MTFEVLADFGFGHRAFARPAGAQCIDESKQVVEFGQTPGGSRHARIERLNRRSLHGAFGIRPDGWKLAGCIDPSSESRRSPRSRQAAGQRSRFRGERIRHTMNEKVAERLDPHSPGLRFKQTRLLQAPDGGVDFRCAHSKLGAEFGIAKLVRSHGEPEGYNDILWLGEHRNTLFANSE
jgi:hypothetical protein